MKNILCLTDFSVQAEKAVQYAARVAQRCHGSLTLLHTLHLHLLDNEKAVPANAQTVAAQKHMAERTLHDTCEQLKEKYKSSDKSTTLTCSSFVREGLLKEVVAEVTGAEKYDLIIMGTTGGGADKLEELIIGSQTVQIFQSNYCPVLAIPADCQAMHLEKIVFATNCYPPEYNAIEKLVPLAQCFNAQIHIVYVGEDDSPATQEKFEKFCRPIAVDMAYDKLHFARITDSDAEVGLMGFVKQTRADMVAMLVRNENFFRKFFHQSANDAAEKVAYNSKVPFMVMHE